MFRNQHLKFGGTGLFGRGLIILQFGLSILLVISTLVMFQQLSYIRTKDLGFDQEQVVVIWTHGINPIDQFRNTLTPYDNIHQVSGSATSFGPDRGAGMVGYGGSDGKKLSVYE
jgi:putative ABC transport system permease protein